MGVIARKIVGSVEKRREWPCGQFDALPPGHGWEEISRDCEVTTVEPYRPYASGRRRNVAVAIAETAGFAKYFPGEDNTLSELPIGDLNGGVLPANHCGFIAVYQNGVKLPCTVAYSVNYTTLKIVLNADWLVRGASYEVILLATSVPT
jgi:hypothetical protein